MLQVEFLNIIWQIMMANWQFTAIFAYLHSTNVLVTNDNILTFPNRFATTVQVVLWTAV